MYVSMYLCRFIEAVSLMSRRGKWVLGSSNSTQLFNKSQIIFAESRCS